MGSCLTFELLISEADPVEVARDAVAVVRDALEVDREEAVAVQIEVEAAQQDQEVVAVFLLHLDALVQVLEVIQPFQKKDEVEVLDQREVEVVRENLGVALARAVVKHQKAEVDQVLQ